MSFFHMHTAEMTLLFRWHCGRAAGRNIRTTHDDTTIPTITIGAYGDAGSNTKSRIPAAGNRVEVVLWQAFCDERLRGGDYQIALLDSVLLAMRTSRPGHVGKLPPYVTVCAMSLDPSALANAPLAATKCAGLLALFSPAVPGLPLSQDWCRWGTDAARCGHQSADPPHALRAGVAFVRCVRCVP